MSTSWRRLKLHVFDMNTWLKYLFCSALLIVWRLFNGDMYDVMRLSDSSLHFRLDRFGVESAGQGDVGGCSRRVQQHGCVWTWL